MRDRHISPKIDEVMLASAADDSEVFGSEIAQVGQPHPNFTLFVARDDKALGLSSWVWGDDARLGAIDPKAEPYSSHLAANHVSVFDLTNAKSGDSFNHEKFVHSPELVRLFGKRLSEGQTVGDDREGPGDRMLRAAARGLGAVETSVEKAETTDPAPGLKHRRLYHVSELGYSTLRVLQTAYGKIKRAGRRRAQDPPNLVLSTSVGQWLLNHVNNLPGKLIETRKARSAISGGWWIWGVDDGVEAGGQGKK